MQLFRGLDTLLGHLYDWIGTAFGIAIGLFAVAIALDLVLRLAKLGNLAGLQEVIEYVLFAGVFLAAPWALRLGAHIRVDVLLTQLPSGLARAADRLLDFLGLVISTVLAWYGWKNLMLAYADDSMQRKYFDVPEWWLLSVFVICFVLLGLEFLFRIIRAGAAPEARADREGGL